MKDGPAWHARADAWFKALGAVVIAYLIAWRLVEWLVEFYDVTIIAVGGLLVAYLVLPIVRRLNVRLPLWLALSIVYVGIALVIVAGVWLLVPSLISQFQQLLTDVPAMQRMVESYLSRTHNPLITHLPPQIRGYVAKLPGQVATEVQRVGLSLSAHVFPAVLSLATIGALVVAIPVVSLYMLGESAMAKRFFARLIPAEHRSLAMDVLADVDGVLGGFVRGQVIVAAAVGAMAIVALLILGVPYAVLIGAWAGIADVIPYIGPFAGAIPAALVALFAHGWTNMLFVVVAFTIVNQIEAHLLGPRIVGSTTKVTPLAVIFALLIGAHILGLLGLLIAVPAAGVIRAILIRFFPDEEITNAEIRPGLTQSPQVDVDPAATET
ncbi:MAG TPA: AI-2E family transporter [Candidatus Baltobacteraceae bacterium]|nr:AI-2E family transporter [Candidatus Baltobacteraceae bacterium]